MKLLNMKKIYLPFFLAIIFMIIKTKFITKNLDISSAIVYMYNSFEFECLIDVYSIAVYAIPISIWTFVLGVRCNEFYENYTFLVTRLGGQAIYNRILIKKELIEGFVLIFTTYVGTSLLLFISGHHVIGNIKLILVSFLLNYINVLILVTIILMLRVYCSFSISMTNALFVQIALLAIGLFLKYFQLDNLNFLNPMLNNIMYFHGEPGGNGILILNREITMNVLMLGVLLFYNMIFLGKRRNLNA
ncbi:hypothetical protein [Clostridium ihumii]|uniref:hypothetical protein n=1 Tax=Clostridium ihumii TaxID=1470356 RepID=UPI003D3446F5